MMRGGVAKDGRASVTKPGRDGANQRRSQASHRQSIGREPDGAVGAGQCTSVVRKPGYNSLVFTDSSVPTREKSWVGWLAGAWSILEVDPSPKGDGQWCRRHNNYQ